MSWPLWATHDSKFANIFGVFPGPPTLSAPHEQTVYVVLGQLTPPVLSDPAAAESFITAGAEIPVTPLASYAISIERALELRNLIDNAIAQVQTAQYE